MPLSASEIVVASNGSIKVAPVGTVGPADPTVAWAAAWIDLGYATEDGVQFSREPNTEDVMGWQSVNPLRVIPTGQSMTVATSLLQWNETSVPLAFGGGSITTTAGPPAHYRYDFPSAATVDERALGIEWVDGTKTYRLVLARVVLTDAVEFNLTKSAATELPMTFKVLGTDGAAPGYIRTNDPAWAA